MTSRVQIPRGDSGRGPWWRPITQDGRRTAQVCCPGCGTVAALDHEIAEDGTVSPSLLCPGLGCSWHVWARLVGWVSPEADTAPIDVG